MKTKRRLLSIIFAVLLIFSHISVGGVTALADPSEDSTENLAILAEDE